MPLPDRPLIPPTGRPASLLLHGASLTVLREGREMSPSAAADKIGRTEAVLRRWERGTHVPSGTEVRTLMDVYGVVDCEGTMRRLRGLRYAADRHAVRDSADGWLYRMWRVAEQAHHRTVLAVPRNAPRLVRDLASPSGTDGQQVTLVLPDSILHPSETSSVTAGHLLRLADDPLIECRLYPTAMAVTCEGQGLLSRFALPGGHAVWVDQDPAPTYRTGPRSAEPTARLASVTASAWSPASSARRLTEAAHRMEHVYSAGRAAS
ncbi:helix-turn-helix transcriptional regulator [Streptomyces sp. NPDC088124]|uniref:helix-turn-helix domain-containing protein n=1 Tax=Streptomyces sp. NPDC088124 TaxID=3154654 RepID=UPI00342826DA